MVRFILSDSDSEFLREILQDKIKEYAKIGDIETSKRLIKIISSSFNDYPTVLKDKKELKDRLTILYECMQDDRIEEHYKQRDFLGDIISSIK